MPIPRKRLARVALVIATVIVIEYVAVHLLPGVTKAWHSVGQGAPIFLALGLLLEVASVLSYSAITATLLPHPRPQLGYRKVLAIDVTGLGFSHVMPGGGASAAALRIRLWAKRGITTADAVSTGAVEYAVNVLWLIAALLLGAVVAAPHPSTRTAMRAALVVSVVLLMSFAALVAVLVARPDQVVSFSQWTARRLPLVPPHVLERLARSMIDQVHLALTSHARSRRAIGWGLANWGLDAASLFMCVRAFGPLPNLGGLLTTYALVNLLALLPITPGGLGLVEGVAIPSLASFGIGPATALLGVLSWRLFEFWAPIPVALGSLGWLKWNERSELVAKDLKSG